MSSLPKLLYFVTVSCFQLSPLIIFEKCMLFLMRKKWASKINFQETCLKASKKFVHGVFSDDCSFYTILQGWALREKCEKWAKNWLSSNSSVIWNVKFWKKSGTLEKVWNNNFSRDQLSKLVIEPNFIVDFLWKTAKLGSKRYHRLKLQITFVARMLI